MLRLLSLLIVAIIVNCVVAQGVIGDQSREACSGAHDCVGTDHGCLCRDNNATLACDAGFLCNDQTNRCYECPVGAVGCACDENDSCSTGLVCRRDVCAVETADSQGHLGLACFSAEQPYLQCAATSLFCDSSANTCTVCDSTDGVPLGCLCASSDECKTGLTCDVASSTCATCPSDCAGDCLRSFVDMGREVVAHGECGELRCGDCRRMSGCKWCNRGGIGACVGIEQLCPNLYASVDNDMACPSDDTPITKFTDPCNKYTCTGCLAAIDDGEDCKFCHHGGDWMCRSSSEECLGPHKGQNKATCEKVECENPECENGECVFDTDTFNDLQSITGRPICACNVGWKLDEKLQCTIKTSDDAADGFQGSKKGNGAAAAIGITIAVLVIVGLSVSYIVIKRRKATNVVSA